ncbi:hypothetical protein [Pontixanthobacter sp. CEM42]|uniref:hypothetical protein n=1 Tax=Pontixanthobacter sp. CEM42 TaxID=2792077 RepID=UPI001ADF21AF|nr:hypothetical protein [Pontixanthobacter sp. CEM42]
MTSITSSERDQATVDNSESLGLLSLGWRSRMCKFGLLGFLIIGINAPQFWIGVVSANVDNQSFRAVLVGPSSFLQALWLAIVGQEPAVFFQRAMIVAFILIAVFLLLSALISLRERNWNYVRAIFGGALTGFFTIYAISWLVIILASIVGAGVLFFGWIGDGATSVTAFAYDLWWQILLLLVCITLFVWRKELKPFALEFRVWVVKHWLKVIAAVVGIAFAFWVFPFVLDWIVYPLVEWVLKPIGYAIAWMFGWVFYIVSTLFIVALTCFGLALVGSLLVSQIQAGIYAGSSVRFGLVAGFAIGSFLTLIFTVSVGNAETAQSLNQSFFYVFSAFSSTSSASSALTDTFVLFLPETVENFVFANLDNQQAPAFDALILVALLVLAVMSLWYRYSKAHQVLEGDVTTYFVCTEYLKMVGGMIVVVFIIVFGSLLSQE